MLPGFNHNIRHDGRVYHVQTEDSGVVQAQLTTQVFLDGQLLSIARTQYRDIIDGDADAESQRSQIRHRMQEQHKKLLKSVVEGQYDSQVSNGGAKAPSPVSGPPRPAITSGPANVPRPKSSVETPRRRHRTPLLPRRTSNPSLPAHPSPEQDGHATLFDPNLAARLQKELARQQEEAEQPDEAEHVPQRSRARYRRVPQPVATKGPPKQKTLSRQSLGEAILAYLNRKPED